ncbi:iron ABC transporter permease [Ramlibacter henchirensis]|uniref:Iron ABC transporter permease n=1 Tax=Ramlibacter henchirensis TaxID=204072 RepID=A0A4Z0BUT9_9BURK|nr:ABC transporter permease subunit [Ramlibacter henchirensis]TFZ02591.1 iron ABC transporter permease [Ramlibacter henchirensis]
MTALAANHPGGGMARIPAHAGAALLVAGVGFFFVWPVLMQVLGIFRDAAPGSTAAWSLQTLTRVYSNPETYAALKNSLIYAVSTTLLATLLALVLALLATRTSVRLGWLVTPVMVLVFAAPNLFYAISWSLLADPGAGLLNQAVRAATNSSVTPFNAYSWTGLVAVQSLKLTGFCYLMLLGPFQRMNRSYEEASLISGAGRFRTIVLVTIPSMTPAIFGVLIVGIVFGMGTFDIPQILGGLANISFLSTEIFKSISYDVPADYGRASALSLFVMAALALMLLVQWSVVKPGRFVTVTGKAFRGDNWQLGAWGHAGTALIAVFTIAALLLPVVQLVITSFQPAIGVWRFTSGNYTAVLRDSQTVAAFRLTAVLAITGGLAAVLLAALLAHVGRHSRPWMERLLDLATLLPIVMPGVALAVALLWAYISVPGLRALYGTAWLALIGLVVAVMPIASRAVRGGLAQIGRELEEAATVSGASPLRVLGDVVLRLIAPSLVAGWIVSSVIIAGTLDVPLMLLSSTRPTVSMQVFGVLQAGSPTQAAALLVLLLACILAVTCLYGAWRALRR